jgi:hypothetical protein
VCIDGLALVTSGGAKVHIHFEEGGQKAGVEIEATGSSAKSGFNFADPTIGLNVRVERSMNYCAVGQTDVIPYFSIHKLREIAPGDWSLYRYGLSG